MADKKATFLSDQFLLPLEALENCTGSKRVTTSPLVRDYAVGGDLGLFSGATCDKAFLTADGEKKLWRYLQKPRNISDIYEFLKGLRLSQEDYDEVVTSALDLARNRFLVGSEVSTRSLADAAINSYATWPQLKYLYIFPSRGCNFSCPYCFATANLDPAQIKAVITPKKLRMGIDLFYKNLDAGVVPNINLFGGEPLLHFELLKEAVFYIQRRDRIRISRNKQIKPAVFRIFTNGALINKDIAEWLFTNDISATVSLDGRRKTHDQMRLSQAGKATFDPVMLGIEHLERANCSFAICMTIGRQNIEDLEANVKWVCNNVSRSLVFNIMQNFLNKTNPECVPISKTGLLFEVLERLYGYFERHDISEAKSQGLWDCFLANDRMIKHCTAHGNEVVLMPDGSFAPCHHLGPLDHDKVFPRQGLRILETRVWKKWANRSFATLEICNKNCPFRLMCAGGCAIEAVSAGNGFYGCSPMACKWIEFHIEYMMKRYHRLYVKNSQGSQLRTHNNPRPLLMARNWLDR